MLVFAAFFILHFLPAAQDFSAECLADPNRCAAASARAQQLAEEKFCNPDYIYAPGEEPYISGRCIAVPKCDAAVLPGEVPVQLMPRCQGKI